MLSRAQLNLERISTLASTMIDGAIKCGDLHSHNAGLDLLRCVQDAEQLLTDARQSLLSIVYVMQNTDAFNPNQVYSAVMTQAHYAISVVGVPPPGFEPVGVPTPPPCPDIPGLILPPDSTGHDELMAEPPKSK